MAQCQRQQREAGENVIEGLSNIRGEKNEERQKYYYKRNFFCLGRVQEKGNKMKNRSEHASCNFLDKQQNMQDSNYKLAWDALKEILFLK